MVTRKAYAKINLGLDVTGRRQDGYHTVRMVMQTVTLHDTVSLEPTEDGTVTMTIDGPNASGRSGGLLADDSNLCIRSARLVKSLMGPKEGVHISLTKRIPIAAGLAGGSTDAAAVLCGMNELFGLGLSQSQLMEYGLQIGADVPFCIMGHTALAEGIGEKLTPLDATGFPWFILIAKPAAAVSTAEVYRALDQKDGLHHPDIDTLVDAIRTRNDDLALGSLGNILEEVTIPMHPEIRAIKDFIRTYEPGGVLMSGSGPTVFAIFEDPWDIAHCKSALQETGLAEELFIADLI